MMLVTYTQEIPVLEPMVIVAPRNVAFYPFPDVFGHQEKQSRHPSDTVGVPNVNTPHISTKEFGEHSPIVEGKQAPHAVVGIKKQNKTIGSKRGLWSDNEHTLFMKGYEKHGRNWALIAKEYVHALSHMYRFIATRTRQQVRSHAQKFFKRGSDDDSGDDTVNKEF
jgi:SHAQKYF class myb-like DNA-binding protein